MAFEDEGISLKLEMEFPDQIGGRQHCLETVPDAR